MNRLLSVIVFAVLLTAPGYAQDADPVAAEVAWVSSNLTISGKVFGEDIPAAAIVNDTIMVVGAMYSVNEAPDDHKRGVVLRIATKAALDQPSGRNFLYVVEVGPEGVYFAYCKNLSDRHEFVKDISRVQPSDGK